MDRRERVEDACGQAVAVWRDLFGDALVAAALFGSAARDPDGPWNDLDFYLVAHGADREAQARAIRSLAERIEDPISVLSCTPEYFDRDVSPLQCDLALDARVLVDSEEWMASRLARLRRILDEAGMYREDLGRGSFAWLFRDPPHGPWTLDWNGFRDHAA